jgi:hypothetical protein
VTVTVVLAEHVPAVATIYAVPALIAVTVPVLSTVATEVLVDISTGFLVAGVMVYDTLPAAPVSRLSVAGESESAVTSSTLSR